MSIHVWLYGQGGRMLTYSLPQVSRQCNLGQSTGRGGIYIQIPYMQTLVLIKNNAPHCSPFGQGYRLPSLFDNFYNCPQPHIPQWCS
jgi:hypothetical protein